MNVYAWIREGVKRAVLLGFSDAVEQLGVPHGEEENHARLLGVLRGAELAPVAAEAPRSGGKRRLGRSLDQISGESTGRRSA